MISIIGLFVLVVVLMLWWRNSLAWVVLYLSGALFFILFGIYEDFYLTGHLIADQHFFASNAVELCSGVANSASTDLRYSLYIYFIANSTFSCDYNSIAFFGKFSFALLWSILISAVAHYSFKFREVSFWNHFSVFALVVLGWFFSAFLLRDGLVALSLSLIFIPFLVGSGFSKKVFLVTMGIVALYFLRPQFLPALLLGVSVALILHLFKNRMQPIKAFSILFFSSLLMLLVFPVPAFIGDLMAAYLTPHGTTATANSRFSAEQIREIFSGGGIEASRYFFSQVVSRFPSVFYEPNPLRSLVWVFSRDELGASHTLRVYDLLVSAMTELVSWFFVVLVFWSFVISKKNFYNRLSSVYTVFLVFFVSSALIYVIKYMGFNHRVFLGFVTVAFVIFAFKHPTPYETRRVVLPALFLWMALQTAYVLIKPFDFIWVYL